MVGGGTRFSQDIHLIYVHAGRFAWHGLNLVGLRRRGFNSKAMENIHNAYRIVYQGSVPLNEALQKYRKKCLPSPEVDYIIEFIENSKKRICPLNIIKSHGIPFYHYL